MSGNTNPTASPLRPLLGVAACLLAGGIAMCNEPTDDLALQAPPVIINPGPEYAASTRIFQGIPGIERTRQGRLWATWYGGGPTEGPWNYVMLASSDDDGVTWTDVRLIINPTDPVRAFDPALWMDPCGRLWLFWAQAWDMWDGRAGVWAIVTADPDAGEPVWSAPRRLCNGIMMNKPVALSDGRWLLPAAVWALAPMTDHPEHKFDLGAESGSNVVVSADQGETWSYLGGADVKGRQCDEHMVVERRDGSLWLLARTTYGIGESLSTDGGRTWSPPRKSWIPHVPAARFFIRRLASGRLLLVKHTPMDGRTRSDLTAYLSDDDGRTWRGELLIDERPGVSYPDATEAPDGTIYLIYDYSRYAEKQVLMATFTEEDVLNGEPVSGRMRLRVLVNQATGQPTAEALQLSDNADGEPLLTGPGAVVEAGELEADALEVGALLFADRNYTAEGLPAELAGCHYLRGSIDGKAVLRAKAAGVIYVLTPLVERNRDSREVHLLREGFVKAAVPEFILFGGSVANACSVFQREFAAGEELRLGKWCVAVLRNR